jgi:hypothetical protein
MRAGGLGMPWTLTTRLGHCTGGCQRWQGGISGGADHAGRPVALSFAAGVIVVVIAVAALLAQAAPDHPKTGKRRDRFPLPSAVYLTWTGIGRKGPPVRSRGSFHIRHGPEKYIFAAPRNFPGPGI